MTRAVPGGSGGPGLTKGSLSRLGFADPDAAAVLPILADRAGRVLVNGWPTGVSVTWAMQHGGPYPATTDARFTSVGTASIDRFLRPVTYQNVPQDLLPEALRDDNPWGIPQTVHEPK